MSEGSEVSKVNICVQILKWRSRRRRRRRRRVGIELPGQLKIILTFYKTIQNCWFLGSKTHLNSTAHLSWRICDQYHIAGKVEKSTEPLAYCIFPTNLTVLFNPFDTSGFLHISVGYFSQRQGSPLSVDRNNSTFIVNTKKLTTVHAPPHCMLFCIQLK